jgi:molecular chaperone GrpE
MAQDKATTPPSTDADKAAPESTPPPSDEVVADAADPQADPVSEAGAPDTDEPDLDLLRNALATAEERANKNQDAMLRTQAEMENLRKRQRRELENAHKFALDKIAMELLPVCDTLEMGVAAASAEEADVAKILEGSELTLKMLTQALEKFNIVEVNPLGGKFDPDLHQAISTQEGTDNEANTVINVLQKGYTLNERLLRPAMVIIAK